MSNKRILIIEDDDAADSLSAISEARKPEPDLIILDLGLPAGDGFIVLERLRAITHLAVIPVIVVSARDPHANKERALRAGAKAYVQKPWNDHELLAIIGQHSANRTHPCLNPSEINVQNIWPSPVAGRAAPL